MASSATRSRPARRSRRPDALIVSCEHGGNRVPARYRAVFARAGALLDSHRGVDFGSAQMAARLARAAAAPALIARTTRLLVDLNRSEHHPALYSELTRRLPEAERERRLHTHYRPYRARVADAIAAAIAGGRRAIHVSSHSFTPVLDGAVRNADVGLLYDPARAPERTFAAAWRAALLVAAPQLRVRRNYPYRGVGDGLVTTLRRLHPAEAYVAIELEMNQRLVGGRCWPALMETIAETLEALLSE
jgi:predicted N-formylglutamate amidohydrolase